MAAYDYTQPADASVEAIARNYRASIIDAQAGTSAVDGYGPGPIPFVTRYSPGGTTSYLFVQTDRVLTNSVSMTTITNYTISGPSAPTVTAVAFTNGKTYIRLSLSGTLTIGQDYTLSILDNVFSDGVATIGNWVGAVPIYLD